MTTTKTNGDVSKPAAMKRAALFGSGRMARAAGRILGAGGTEVRLFARNKAAAQELQRENPKLKLASRMSEAVDGAELIFFAVPAQAIGDVAASYGEYALGDHIVLHAARGVGEGFMLPHKMIRAKTCVRKIGVLGGPLHATELTSGRPLAAVLASRFQETIAFVQALTKGTPVIVHGSRDVVGVEVAGALSNVAAIAAGMSDALDLGDTARGILLTHGLAEAKKIGASMGAESSTFAGLAGVGDLIPRRVSSTDRHRLLGARIAAGRSLAEATAEVGANIEGVLTAREAAKLPLELPLVRAVDAVLSGRERAKDALENVLRLGLELDFAPRVPAGARAEG